MLYLATPFSNGDKAENYQKACRIRSGLLESEYSVYSPIVENYHFAQEYNLDSDYKAWESYNTNMILSSIGLIIDLIEFTVSDYRNSIGCIKEIKHAIKCEKSIFIHQYDSELDESLLNAGYDKIKSIFGIDL